MDVARLNMSHGTHEQHRRAYDLVRKAADTTGHGVGIFADLQGPKIRLGEFAEGSAVLEKGQSWTITTRDVPGDATICSTTYKGLPGRRLRGRPDPHRRRPDPADGHRRRRRRRGHRGRGGRQGEQPQGHQPARCGRLRPRAVGEGRRGPALRAQPQRGLRGAVVRPLRHRRRRRPQGDAGGGRPRPGDREDREAAGHRQPRRDRARLRRPDGRPRRPRGRVPARGRPVPAEARRRPGPGQREAGDRGHPDAGVDDLRAGAHPRRGHRRRARGARRRGRGDALGRDQRGGVPHPHGRRRWPASWPPPRTTACRA